MPPRNTSHRLGPIPESLLTQANLPVWNVPRREIHTWPKRETNQIHTQAEEDKVPLAVRKAKSKLVRAKLNQ